MEKKPLLADDTPTSYTDGVNASGSTAVDATDASLRSSINVPEDKYHAVYIILFIQGVGMLLPWNLFITANDYFQDKFERDPYAKHKFENAFSLAAMIPNVLSLLVNIFLTSRVSRNARVIPALLTTIIIMLITTVFVKVDTVSWTRGFFILSVLSVAVLNICTGIFQGAMFGVAGAVGDRYTQALMLGQGVSGIFVALASVLTKIGKSYDVKASALAYFITACVVISISVAAYSVLFRMPLMQYHFFRLQRKLTISHAVNTDNLSDDGTEVVTESTKGTPYWLIFKQISPLAISVGFLFFVTLALFPAIVSNIQSVNKDNGSDMTNKYFSPLMCFMTFNVGDFIGRLVAANFQITGERGPWLPLMCFLRVAFIPLFMFCNYQPRVHTKAYFMNDWIPAVLNLCFSISNGYLGSLCMMFGPKRVLPEHAETAGTIMAFFLTFGLSLGAGFSFALVELV